jgi:TRAP-type mannitol/chloroaromatic compound transport system permease small subunit
LSDSQNSIDRLSNATGKFVAWLTLLMVIVTCIIVVLRYVFDAGLIWMQESVVWMHGTVFMIGAAYTLLHEDHVRVDVFYRAMSERRRAWVDLIGVVVFLLPLCVLLVVRSYDFAAFSWSIHEASRESGGLPYPFVSILKSVLVVMPIAVGLQGISLLLRSVATIRRA